MSHSGGFTVSRPKKYNQIFKIFQDFRKFKISKCGKWANTPIPTLGNFEFPEILENFKYLIIFFWLGNCETTAVSVGTSSSRTPLKVPEGKTIPTTSFWTLLMSADSVAVFPSVTFDAIIDQVGQLSIYQVYEVP
jgi:hypothetical protein